MKVKRLKRTKGKLTQQSIHVKGKWKAVELDPSVFSEEGLEGLVCFEELKSYRLMDPDKAAAKAVKQLQQEKLKGKKRKAGEGGEKAEDATEPAKKKAKKKNKKKNKKPAAQEAEGSLEEGVEKDEGAENGETAEGDEPSSSAASEQQSKVNKKGKKQKNKKNQKQQNEAEEEPSSEPASELASELASEPASEPASEAQVLPEEEPSQEKVAKPAKKQVKNWTNAGLSGSDDKSADVSAWRDLFVPSDVLKALSSLGFGSPTPIQALALPSAIRDRLDILGAAETGSGKTLAFGIPMIHTILEWRKAAEDAAEESTEAPVESLYLPAVADENAAATAAEPEQEEAAAVEEEERESDEDLKEGESEEDGSDGEGEDGEERLGCVQVIEDVALPQEEESAEDSEKQPLLGLVLTPTRELAVQVKHHIDAVAKFTNIKTAIVVGGMAQQKQRRMLKRRPEIVIATPGRLWDLIQERHPHLLNLRQLRCLVIDEADRMVERGHFAELENLLEMLNTTHFNPKRQTFVFSATLTMVHSLPTRVLQKKKKKVEQRDKVAVLMEKVGIRSKPKVIDLTRKEATAETLTETQIHCQKEEKDFFLYYFLLQYPGRTMVFANSIDCIKRLNSLLVILDRTPLPLHANMHQKQRLKNLERFAEMDSCVLLTTDVAARGLDIPDVQHVIHYQVPRTSETYVHRSGRTARATKEGLSLLLIGPDDVMNFKKIYRTLGKDEDLPMFPIENKCMEAIKERVNLARSIEKIEYYNSRQKQHNSWFKQAAEAMDIDLDEDLLLGKSRTEDDNREQQWAVKGMKKQLKHLISQTVFKNVIKTRYPTQMGKLSLPNMPLVTGQSALTRVSEQKELNLERSRQQQRKKVKRKKKQQQQ